MRVFVTGATGYVGGAVAERLRDAGHAILALARSDVAAALRAAGYAVHRGDLLDLASLIAGAHEADAAVHAGYVHRWDDVAAMAAAERDATRAMLGALGGTAKPFVWSIGSGILGDTGPAPADEGRAPAPAAFVAWRPPIEREVLAAGRLRDGHAVRTAVLRFPLPYGRGGNPVVRAFLEQAARDGVARSVGPGENRRSAVHIDDLADLYHLALEALAAGTLPGGTLLHAAAPEPFAMRALAEAVAKGTGVGHAAPWTLEEARRASPFADLYAGEHRLDAARARELLGWAPRRPSLLDEVARGSYAKPTAAGVA